VLPVSGDWQDERVFHSNHPRTLAITTLRSLSHAASAQPRPSAAMISPLPAIHHPFDSPPVSPFLLPFSSIFPMQRLFISHLTGQRRTMFIQTQATPNPSSLMFYPDKPVMQVGSADFPNPRSAMNSPLAKSLFAIDGLFLSFLPSLSLFPVSLGILFRDSIGFLPLCLAGVTRVFFGSDFVTVTKSEDAAWEFLKPEVFAAIMDFYSSGQPLFLDSQAAAAMDTAIHQVSISQ